ncbi:hypothetical protein [Mycolicibacterium sp. HK-90]|uniref:hypothetical protein n=1 Tax=Mycolicibacterium sp. HK-90 TaxID=3056937 RepID=UPI002659A185|nr:hypothetical protein [Mycolicibacterium sp. HK-90]WKG02293.1 hypothetical protein QU592_24180 [Mycolicibacterium sp. HK-90]
MRRLFCVLAGVGLAMALAGCESYHGKSPFETTLPSAKFGLRVNDGQLRLWTGSPCEGTTQVVLRLDTHGSGADEVRLNTPSYMDEDGLTPGVEFEYFTLGGPHPGFIVKESLRPGFDWREAEFLDLEIAGPPYARGIGALRFAPIASEIIRNSVEHPEDTYYFHGLGWLNPDEVAAKDGKEFVALCTPDPGRGEGIEAVVGVRVTEGTLRFWTGSPCPFNSGVILTFQPGQAEAILQRTENSNKYVEYLNFGGPDPALTVTHPLRHDFDWRTAESVLFRLIETDWATSRSNRLVWSKTTQLATPIAESAQHPPDTYYFEGIGWLNPAEVAARDGTSMQTICGKQR